MTPTQPTGILRRLRRDERGQTATEYLLAISVVAIAMVGATFALTDSRGAFHRSMRSLSDNVETLVAKPPDTRGPEFDANH